MPDTIQNIHKDLMDEISAAFNNAADKIEQIDPSCENYFLQMVLNVSVFTPDPTSPVAQRAMLNGQTLVGNRSGIAEAAAILAVVVGNTPATEPDPEGFVGFDEISVSTISGSTSPTNLFSIN
jgi:hypothetical protein